MTVENCLFDTNNYYMFNLRTSDLTIDSTVFTNNMDYVMYDGMYHVSSLLVLYGGSDQDLILNNISISQFDTDSDAYGN